MFVVGRKIGWVLVYDCIYMVSHVCDHSSSMDDDGGSMGFTEEERAELLTLKNREYLIDDEGAVFLALLDLLLAIAYDHRTTGGESTVSQSVANEQRLELRREVWECFPFSWC